MTVQNESAGSQGDSLPIFWDDPIDFKRTGTRFGNFEHFYLLMNNSGLDIPVFLNFLRDELDRKGIELTINRTNDLHLVPLNMSNIIGVELDPSEHDKEKDAEIEKYKKAFESAKCERDKAICEYQNEIDRLKSRLRKLEESQETLPTEPIKMADWIVHHFEQGIYPIYETNHKGEIRFIEIGEERVPVETGEYTKHREVREIADYLFAYCKYHSEED